MKRMWIAALAVLLSFSFARAQEMKKPPSLPEGLPGVVEFHNLNTVQEHMQAFIAVASPETPPLAMLSMGLAMMAKTMNPAVMDAARPMRILLVKSAEGKLSLVLQFSATDFAAYTGSLLPALVKGEEKDGITSYTQEKQQFDQKAFQQATPEEQKNFQRFMMTTQAPVAIGAADKVVCVGDNVPAVRAALALARSGALGDAPLLEGGDVAAQVEVNALLSHLAKGQASAFAGFKEEMKGMLSMMRLPQGQNAEPFQRVLDIEIDAFESLAKQVERVSARLDFGAQDARLSLSLSPVPGGKLAGYLASVQPGVPATLKYLPNDSFLVTACKVGNLDPLVDTFTAFMTRVNAVVGTDPAAAGALAQRGAEIIRAFGDEFACGLRSGQGVRMVETIRLKDPASFKAAMKKMPELMAPLTNLYRSMGMGMQLQSETIPYGAHEISRWKWVFDAKPPEGATPEQAAAFAEQQKMMKAMYGDAMTMDSAVLEKDFVLAAGKDSLDTLKQILDAKQEKITDSDSFKQMLAALPPQATGFILIHVTGLVDWTLSQARAAQQAGNMPMMIPAINFQPGPGATAIFLNSPDGSLNCALRVPAAEIKAVVDGVKAAGPAAGEAPPATVPAPPIPQPQ